MHFRYPCQMTSVSHLGAEHIHVSSSLTVSLLQVHFKMQLLFLYVNIQKQISSNTEVKMLATSGNFIIAVYPIYCRCNV